MPASTHDKLFGTVFTAVARVSMVATLGGTTVVRIDSGLAGFVHSSDESTSTRRCTLNFGTFGGMFDKHALQTPVYSSTSQRQSTLADVGSKVSCVTVIDLTSSNFSWFSRGKSKSITSWSQEEVQDILLTTFLREIMLLYSQAEVSPNSPCRKKSINLRKRGIACTVGWKSPREVRRENGPSI